MENTSHPLAVRAPELYEMYKVCDTCVAFIHRTMSHCPFGSDRELDRAFSEYERHRKSSACKKFGTNRSHEGNGKYLGAWAFTLTKAPTDPLSVGDMLAAVRKVMSQKTAPVIKYAWYYEDKGRDADGNPIHPHIHGMYTTESGGRVPKRQWERAWEIWDENKPIGVGFRGGYHRPVRDGEAYTDYISKDGGMSESKGL